MKYYYYTALAWLRGFLFNHVPYKDHWKVPSGCDRWGFARLTSKECRRMYRIRGWKPLVFYYTKGCIMRKFYCER